MATIKQLKEEGNFPPAKLIGAGMKYAKKRHGLDLATKYKEMPPEAKKLGWRVAHSLWRKEKAAARKAKKKPVAEAKGDWYYQSQPGKTKKAFNMSRYLEKADKNSTVLSGGEHQPVDNKTHGGKREKITVGTGGVTQFRVHTKEDVSEPIQEVKALTVAQRLQRGRQIRRIKPKLQRAAKRSLTQSPSSNRLWKRSERAARNALKKRYSPVKGMAYSQLSTTQKIMVDKIVAKKQKTIKKLAKRLLPKIRKQSFQRLANYRSNLGRPNRKMNESFEEMFNARPLPVVISDLIGDLGDHPMAESLNTLLDLSSGQDSPSVRSLKEKADKAGVTFQEVLQVYADALLKYQTADTRLTAEQYAFNAVNSAVANAQKDINESFGQMSENLAGILIGNHMMFGKTSIISKGFGGGTHYGGGGGGGTPPKRVNKDDEHARGISLHTYAKGLHHDRVTAAGDDPTRHRYVPNQKLLSKAKHSSRHSQWEAERVDHAHRAAKASFPTEYSVSPRHAITAHFLKNPADRHLEPKVQEYEGHYAAAVAQTKKTKGSGAPKRIKESNEMFVERFSSKKHDGKRETDSTKVHDIHWKGKNTGHKLIRVSTGVTTGGDRYKLQTSAGHTSKISMTAAAWNKHLTRHFKMHDKRRALRSESVAEEHEVDTLIQHIMASVKAAGGPKKYAGTAFEYAKQRAKAAARKKKPAKKETE